MLEIFIDGCDNYIFDEIDAEYAFARKKSRKANTERVDEILSEEKLVKISYIIGGDGTVPVISA